MTRIDSDLFASQIAPRSIFNFHPPFMCTGCRLTSMTLTQVLCMQNRDECSICWAVAPSHPAVLASQLTPPRLDCGRHPFKKSWWHESATLMVNFRLKLGHRIATWKDASTFSALQKSGCQITSFKDSFDVFILLFKDSCKIHLTPRL